ncbi:hypothetical protein FACS1894198_2750 [Clostridia bacterium]|nr:hypothetical protein FACS1894198_2750 [Clostridia bacterium]
MVITNYQSEIPERLEKLIEDEHIKYESEKGVSCNYSPFYFVATKQNIVVGITTGYSCYAEIYIDDLVVLAKHRNNGIGKKMLEAIEEHFSGAGFDNINLVTNEFQSPDFYKKCGYTLEFVRQNKKNPRFNKYFFVKFFNNEA